MSPILDSAPVKESIPVSIQEDLTWQSYWNSTCSWTYPELFRVNAEFFIKKAAPYLRFSPQDRVLNIGCGPGFLERRLAPEVHSIVAADTSDYLLGLCAEGTRDLKNVRTVKLGEDYTDLIGLGSQHSLFLCISVIQYYTHVQQVEALIRSAQQSAAPGARMLIADIPQQLNVYEWVCNAAGSLFRACREKYAAALIWQMIRRWKQILHDQKCSETMPHLYLSRSDLQDLVKRMGLQAEIINESFSICANRVSLLIRL